MLCKACFRPHLGVFHHIGVLVRGGGGGGGVGGGSQGIGTQPAYAIFSLWTAQKAKFSKLVFLILRPPKMTLHAL